jgi:hypothetical protein
MSNPPTVLIVSSTIVAHPYWKTVFATLTAHGAHPVKIKTANSFPGNSESYLFFAVILQFRYLA